MTTSKIESAVHTWKWLADPANTEPQPPDEQTPEEQALNERCPLTGDAFVPIDARRFSINALHKSALFRNSTRSDVDDILNLLETAGVVGVACQESTRGRPREIRHVAADWICTDNPEAFAKLEAKLTARLLEIEAMSTPEETETLDGGTARGVEPADQKIDLVVAIFDWFSDPEHFEIDSRNQPIFSVIRLCRDLNRDSAVDRSAIDDALALLQRQGILGHRYIEPNVRARELRPITRSWLERGSRDRLLAILRPQPPKPYVPFGFGRMIKTTTVYVGRLLMTFREGDIVKDEKAIRALISGTNWPIVKVEDTTTRMCSHCNHRFDSADAPEIDWPVLEATGRINFTSPSGRSVWLNRGDFVGDRELCLQMTTGLIGERVKHDIRILQPHEYMACPNCKRVSRRENATSLQGNPNKHLAVS